jgi:hypothetical protein
MTDSLTQLFEARRAGLDWFNSQLAAVTGIDVLREPFEPTRGWGIYEEGRFRILLIRFEDLARVAPDALQRFFSLESPLSLVHRNQGSTKRYASLYRLFRTSADIPPHILDMAYESDLARHFYTEDERMAFRSAWER